MTDTTDIPQLDNVDAAIDALADAPLLEVYRTLLPFDDQMVTAAAVRRALAGSSTGPTDEVVTIAHGGDDPELLPILAVDIDAQTVTVAGDQTEIADHIAAVPNAPGFFITGSTGNNSFYVPASASYDSGTDRTTIALNTDNGGSISDATADGDLQWSILYVAEIELAPNAAIEWVLIDTTEAWTNPFYGVIGDDDEPEGFCSKVGAGQPGGIDVAGVGRWQWPVNTLDAASSSPVVLIGTYPGIKFYPEGGTIRVIWIEFPAGSAGETTIVVHHHFTEPKIPTRTPPA